MGAALGRPCGVSEYRVSVGGAAVHELFVVAESFGIHVPENLFSSSNDKCQTISLHHDRELRVKKFAGSPPVAASPDS